MSTKQGFSEIAMPILQLVVYLVPKCRYHSWWVASKNSRYSRHQALRSSRKIKRSQYHSKPSLHETTSIKDASFSLPRDVIRWILSSVYHPAERWDSITWWFGIPPLCSIRNVQDMGIRSWRSANSGQLDSPHRCLTFDTYCMMYLLISSFRFKRVISNSFLQVAPTSAFEQQPRTIHPFVFTRWLEMTRYLMW